MGRAEKEVQVSGPFGSTMSDESRVGSRRDEDADQASSVGVGARDVSFVVDLNGGEETSQCRIPHLSASPLPSPNDLLLPPVPRSQPCLVCKSRETAWRAAYFRVDATSSAFLPPSISSCFAFSFLPDYVPTRDYRILSCCISTTV